MGAYLSKPETAKSVVTGFGNSYEFATAAM